MSLSSSSRPFKRIPNWAIGILINAAELLRDQVTTSAEKIVERKYIFFLSFLQEEENQFILNQLGKSERGERREYKREKERVVHPSEGRAAYEAAQSPALVRI